MRLIIFIIICLRMDGSLIYLQLPKQMLIAQFNCLVDYQIDLKIIKDADAVDYDHLNKMSRQ